MIDTQLFLFLIFLLRISMSSAICAAGYSQAVVGGSTACTPCLSGTYATAGSTSCMLCEVNTYSLGQAAQCTSCPSFSSSIAGQSTCSCDLVHITFGIGSTLFCAEYPTGQPTRSPTSQPSSKPSRQPTGQPTRQPTAQPIGRPTSRPTGQPSSQPSSFPTCQPTTRPSSQPTGRPTHRPTSQPSGHPTRQPSSQPSARPTSQPSASPTGQPTSQPSTTPTAQPSIKPSSKPSPADLPSSRPTMQPFSKPTGKPSAQPSLSPTAQPSTTPTASPITARPTSRPSTSAPSSSLPTSQPSRTPSSQPSTSPTPQPSRQPTAQPTSQPSSAPSSQPTLSPTTPPTAYPSPLAFTASGVPDRKKYLAAISSTIVVSVLLFAFIVGYGALWYRKYKRSNKLLSVYIVYGDEPGPWDETDGSQGEEAKVAAEEAKVDPEAEKLADMKVEQAFTAIATSTGRGPGGWSLGLYDYEELEDAADDQFRQLFLAPNPSHDDMVADAGGARDMTEYDEDADVDEDCSPTPRDHLQCSLSSMEQGRAQFGDTSAARDSTHTVSAPSASVRDRPSTAPPILSRREGGIVGLTYEGQESDDAGEVSMTNRRPHTAHPSHPASSQQPDDSLEAAFVKDLALLDEYADEYAETGVSPLAEGAPVETDTPAPHSEAPSGLEKRTRRQQIEMVLQQTLKTISTMKFANVSDIVSPYSKKLVTIGPAGVPTPSTTISRPPSSLDPRGPLITGKPPELKKNISASPYLVSTSMEAAVIADIKNKRKYISFFDKYRPASKVVGSSTPAISSIVASRIPVNPTPPGSTSTKSGQNSLSKAFSLAASSLSLKQPPVVPAMSNTVRAPPATTLAPVAARTAVILNTAVVVVKPFMWDLPGVQYAITSALSANAIRITKKAVFTSKQLRTWRLFDACFSRLNRFASVPPLDWPRVPLSVDEQIAFAHEFSDQGESWVEAVGRRAVVSSAEVMALLKIEEQEEFYRLCHLAEHGGQGKRLSKGLHVTKLQVPFPSPEMTEEMQNKARLEREAAALAKSESGWANIHMISEDLLQRMSSGEDFQASGDPGDVPNCDSDAAIALAMQESPSMPHLHLTSEANWIEPTDVSPEQRVHVPAIGADQGPARKEAAYPAFTASKSVLEALILAGIIPADDSEPVKSSRSVQSEDSFRPTEPPEEFSLPVKPDGRATKEPPPDEPEPVPMRWVYVPNAFLGSMREQFVSDGASVCVLSVEWNGAQLSWSGFMDEVVGHRDPSQAAPQSVRGHVFANWHLFGLPEAPSLRGNIIHASASAFEAMVDRLGWQRHAALTADPFYQLMAETTERPFTVQAWVSNPIIELHYSKTMKEFDIASGKRAPDSSKGDSNDDNSDHADEDEDEEDMGNMDEDMDGAASGTKQQLKSNGYRRVFEWFDRLDGNQIMNLAQFIIQKLDANKNMIRRQERKRNSMVVETYKLPEMSPGASRGSPGTRLQAGIQDRRSSGMENGFLIVKPAAACSSEVVDRIKGVLQQRGVRVVKRIEVGAEEIVARNLFERQFGRLWRLGAEARPQSINLTSLEAAAFESTFGVSYRTALGNRRVFNATGARTLLGITDMQLYQMWTAAKVHRVNKGLYVACMALPTAAAIPVTRLAHTQTPTKGARGATVGNKRAAIQGGTHSTDTRAGAAIFTKADDDNIFVVNGFVHAMRERFVSDGASVCVLSVEWNGAKLSWGHFLESVVGDRDPELASVKSIRGVVYDEYDILGLDDSPTLMDNVVYASGSALEALADRMTWFEGTMAFTDLFGSRMIAQRFPSKEIQYWLTNPKVTVDALHINDKPVDDFDVEPISLPRPTSAQMSSKASSRPTSALGATTSSSRPTSALLSQMPNSRPTSAVSSKSSSRPTSALVASRISSRPTSGTVASPVGAVYSTPVHLLSKKSASDRLYSSASTKEARLEQFLRKYPPVNLGHSRPSRYSPADLIRPEAKSPKPVTPAHNEDDGSDDNADSEQDNVGLGVQATMFETTSVPLFTVMQGFGTEDCLEYLAIDLQQREFDRVNNPHLLPGNEEKSKRATKVMGTLVW